MADMRELLLLRLPAVETLFGARPQDSGAIECQGQDPVATDGASSTS